MIVATARAVDMPRAVIVRAVIAMLVVVPVVMTAARPVHMRRGCHGDTDGFASRGSSW